MGRVMGQFTSMNSDQMQSIQGNNPGEPGPGRIAVPSRLQIAIACFPHVYGHSKQYGHLLPSGLGII